MAAGRSYALKDVDERYDDIVLVGPDDFRPFHPHIRDLRREGRVSFGTQEAKAWISEYWKSSKNMAIWGEINPTTAPTFVQLHEDADWIAKVAYRDDPKALDRHGTLQEVQKKIFLAGQNGVPNDQLPKSPQEFLEASPKDRERFTQNLTSGRESSHKETDSGKVGKDDAKSAQILLMMGSRKPPPRGLNATNPPREKNTGKHPLSKDKNPGIER